MGIGETMNDFSFGEVLTRAWQNIWKHKVLWIFGILASCARRGGGGSGGGGNRGRSAGRGRRLAPGKRGNAVPGHLRAGTGESSAGHGAGAHAQRPVKGGAGAFFLVVKKRSSRYLMHF